MRRVRREGNHGVGQRMGTRIGDSDQIERIASWLSKSGRAVRLFSECLEAVDLDEAPGWGDFKEEAIGWADVAHSQEENDAE
jgi:hypothetical protein